MTSATVFRRMLSPPAREGDAGNPGGTWRRVRRRMATRFSGEVDRWTTRPSGRRVDQKDDLKVRNLRRRVRDFPKLSAARGLLSVDRISRFSLRETEEHACVVGFFRRRLDLHRSVR